VEREPYDPHDLPYIILILYLPELPQGFALIVIPWWELE
jgi:hypothetical protein